MALLDSVSKRMPVANKQLEQQRRAAADLQLQKAVAAAPQAAGIGAAQQMGAATAQHLGQQQVAQAQQNVGQVQQAAGAAIQQKSNEIQNSLAAQQQGLQRQQLTDEQQFFQIAGQKKQELFDARKQFNTDEMGRTFMNTRQLADYAKVNAESDEQLADYAQTAEQIADRNIQMMEVAYRKLEQALQFEQQSGSQKMDQQMKMELIQAKQELQRSIAKKKAESANRAGMFSTGMGIAGAVAGSFAGPGGAAAGYQAGTAAGTMTAAATE